ncbi:NDP-hexose 2,3-dehydratase family protein [Myceligenerans salitolerans]|uniref:NDP-hexose 2,3-dehydratase family protein n=1 Tax=Myceligenerans salitolerans TaxID=1230528 RepID=A0ABS3IDT7_9MICO|nr:NDP-hexose 2,3-dehydratase family protein [Myceligenerans salitolerans]MBO0611209.1 NDP-hexose 2,3-dehydratase family protein [Myceligenerans salitolerans]
MSVGSSPVTARGRRAPASILTWLAQYRADHGLQVRRTLLDGMPGWHFDDLGNLVHQTGRFFSVRGLETFDVDSRQVVESGPILLQRDVGVLGIITRRIGGVAHYLMQAKIEPGNPGQVQVSPTVQATRSNYDRAHGGGATAYLDWFLPTPSGQVEADSLQGEHSAVFFHKHNRNMIISVDQDIPESESHRWLTRTELRDCMWQDHVLNMDSRCVLAHLPTLPVGPSRHTDAEVQSWLTSLRATDLAEARLVGLDQVPYLGDRGVIQASADFRVVGVQVSGGNREVVGWSQPLVEYTSTREELLLVAEHRGEPHLLIQARREAGSRAGFEAYPSVTHVGRDSPLSEELRELALSSQAEIVYSTVHSEEGGRFLGANSRYTIARVPDAVMERPLPAGYLWVTPAQAQMLTMGSYTVSVQMRTMLAVLTTGCVVL